MNVYVAKDHAARTIIVAASGIVGTDHGTRVMCWYEGNLYGASNLRTWADRVSRAAGRCRENYPTIATALLDAASLELVGEYDNDTGTIHLIDGAEPAVSAWLGVADIDPERFTTSGPAAHRREAQEYLRRTGTDAHHLPASVRRQLGLT